jgi:hypothetical protein
MDGKNIDRPSPTFNDLPQLVSDLIQKVDLLLEDHDTQIKDEDYLMSVEDLRAYLPENPARQTVYGWINGRRIPYEKHGKRLYFRKSKIDWWLANGRPEKKYMKT